MDSDCVSELLSVEEEGVDDSEDCESWEEAGGDAGCSCARCQAGIALSAAGLSASPAMADEDLKDERRDRRAAGGWCRVVLCCRCSGWSAWLGDAALGEELPAQPRHTASGGRGKLAKRRSAANRRAQQHNVSIAQRDRLPGCQAAAVSVV